MSELIGVEMRCEEYSRTGFCKYGIDCRFSHEVSQEDDADESLGGPGVCKQFLEIGCCKYGDDCRFSHDISYGVDEEEDADDGGSEKSGESREFERTRPSDEFKFKDVVEFPPPFSRTSMYRLIKGSKSEFVEPTLGFKYCPLTRVYTAPGPHGKKYLFCESSTGPDSQGSFKEISAPSHVSSSRPERSDAETETGFDEDRSEGFDPLDPSRRPLVMSLKTGQKGRRKAVPLGPRAHQQGTVAVSSSSSPSSSSEMVHSEFESFFATETQGGSAAEVQGLDGIKESADEDERVARVHKAREEFLRGGHLPPPPIILGNGSGKQSPDATEKNKKRKKRKQEPSRSSGVNGVATALVQDSSNKGNQLLRKMGWDGKGLGKTGAGIRSSDVVTKPHEANSRSGGNARGLGMSAGSNDGGKKGKGKEFGPTDKHPTKKRPVHSRGNYAEGAREAALQRYEALSKKRK